MIVLELIPCFGSSARSHASVSANCEKTSTLVGTTASSSSSFCEIFFNSSTRAVSLDVNSEAPRRVSTDGLTSSDSSSLPACAMSVCIAPPEQACLSQWEHEGRVATASSTPVWVLAAAPPRVVARWLLGACRPLFPPRSERPPIVRSVLGGSSNNLEPVDAKNVGRLV